MDVNPGFTGDAWDRSVLSQQQSQLNDIAIQRGRAEAPADLAMKQAKTREAQLSVQTQEIALNKAKKQMEMMNDIATKFTAEKGIARTSGTQQGGDSPQDNPLGILAPYYAYEESLIKAGMLDEAMKVDKQIAETGEKYAQGRKAIYEGDIKKAEGVISNIKMVEQVSASVGSPEQWDAVRMQMLQSNPNLPDPVKKLLSQPYSPELIDRIHQGAMDAHERETTNLNKLKEQREKDKDAFDREVKKQELHLKELQSDRAERALKLTEQQGKHPQTAPSTGQVKATQAAIKAMYPGMDDSEALPAAEQVASRAKQLQGQNRALTPDEAQSQALLEAQQSGQFVSGSSRSWSDWTGTKPTFSTGLTADKPMEAPTSKENFKVNRFYKFKDGSIAKWTGSGFQPVKVAE